MSSAVSLSDSRSSVTTVRSSLISARWIISRGEDLTWFIGSVAAGYALFGLHVYNVVPLMPLVLAWAVFFDAPHGFATVSRTYFDREERRSRGRLLAGSLLFFLLGPLMVTVGQGLIFFLFVGLWAYYHLVKQHYGFVVLYKKKNDDLLPLDNFLDRFFLLTWFAYPLVAYLAYDREAAHQIPAQIAPVLPHAASIVLFAVIIAGLVWTGRQIQRARRGLAFNLPKFLLLAAALPLHWLTLLTDMPQKPLAAAAILTIFHNIQYSRLVWFHNRKYSARGGDRETLKERYGAAAFVNRRLIYFLFFGLVFGLLCQVPRLYFAGGAENSHWAQVLVSFLVGAALAHYYIDSKIWRVRRDQAVGKALQMQN